MQYYTNLFSPETYEAFSRSDRTISGFQRTQHVSAERVQPGDRLICYMTKLSRWVGVLEVESECFIDESPRFYPEDDPFVVRFRIKPLAWLEKDDAIPIREPEVWDNLSFTKNSGWTGIVRRSLNKMTPEDGVYLERLLTQSNGDSRFPVDQDEYKKLVMSRIRRADRVVSVTVPQDDGPDESPIEDAARTIRESCQIQAHLAECGEKMGCTIWIPRNDRNAVLQEWTPNPGTLIDTLPLNYDDTTLKTIEQIDVLWLKGRAIVRAFEVEHTTAVYSGILRMADLLALQPNMDIKLHIVAPESRQTKVFTEIQRPVFSLLDRAPLSECCTFISYDSVRDLLNAQHLSHLSDTVLDEYTVEAD